MRHKRPVAPSVFYSCGVLPGSEMYPNTTWLDTKWSGGKNLFQNMPRNFDSALSLTSKDGLDFAVLLNVLIAREVNSSDRFHHGFSVYIAKPEPLSEKWPTSFFRRKKSSEHSLRMFGQISFTLRNLSPQKDCIIAWHRKPGKTGNELEVETKRHYCSLEFLFQTRPFQPILLSSKKIYLRFVILDTCIKSIVCPSVSNQKFQIIVDTHF